MAESAVDQLMELARRSRDELTEKRGEIFTRQQALEEELAAINSQIARIDALLNPTAPPSAPAATTRAAKAPNTSKRTRAPRGEGESLRNRVFDMIQQRGERGASAADLHAFLEMDDKAGKQAIANALQALKKDNLIKQPQKRGPYFAVENPQSDREEAA